MQPKLNTNRQSIAFVFSLLNVMVIVVCAGCQTNGLNSLMSRNDVLANPVSASVYGLDEITNESAATAPKSRIQPREAYSVDDSVDESFNTPSTQNNTLGFASSIGSAVGTGVQTSDTIIRGQSPAPQQPVRQVAYQYPETQTQQQSQGFFSGNSGYQLPSINTGSPNEMNPAVPPQGPGGLAGLPTNFADIDVFVNETQTGRINFGGAYNSDNGIVGQFTIDERNFDIWRMPRSFREIMDGTAWRGAGQTFRLELVPGADVQRYLVSFGEPYLFNTPVSLTASAYLFDRQYFDWNEERLGGRVALGYRLTHDLSVSAGVRAENVEINNPRVATSPKLNAALGDTDLFVGHVGLVRDTRDHPFLATEGSYLSMTYNQAFGEFDYARGDIDFRTYRLMYQRPDMSGRHTLSFGTKLGISGKETPIFENYFAGGFSTLRGYDFRGASPVEGDVRAGGRFQWLNSLEYMFPLTADDMIKGVMFCDFGTVESDIELNSENFRVAPGFGFRIHMPAAGIGAPLAFDFAFPVSSADTDEEQVFSFYLGVLR